MSMNPEIKAKWIEALRSGDYEQYTSGLRRGGTNQMCCLGVLCDVIDPTRWVVIGSEGAYKVVDTEQEGVDTRTGYPPRDISELAGITAPWRGGQCDVATYLAHQNDGGASFSEIADLIEKEL